jgi:FixJ family two-component response regulator
VHSAALAIENLKIMLVDDDDSVREALTEILTRRGGWSRTSRAPRAPYPP